MPATNVLCRHTLPRIRRQNMQYVLANGNTRKRGELHPLIERRGAESNRPSLCNAAPNEPAVVP